MTLMSLSRSSQMFQMLLHHLEKMLASKSLTVPKEPKSTGWSARSVPSTNLLQLLVMDIWMRYQATKLFWSKISSYHFYTPPTSVLRESSKLMLYNKRISSWLRKAIWRTLNYQHLSVASTSVRTLCLTTHGRSSADNFPKAHPFSHASLKTSTGYYD